jgi:glycosyltransferase involved in cell wall biosynthesis
MLCRIPVIASKVGAIPELIGEGNGILCENSGAFIRAIDKFSVDNNIYTPLVQEGLAYVKRNFNTKSLTANIKAFKDYF